MMKIKPPCHSAWTAVIELSNIINILITQITPVSSFSLYLCLFMTQFPTSITKQYPPMKFFLPGYGDWLWWLICELNHVSMVTSVECRNPLIQFGVKINSSIKDKAKYWSHFDCSPSLSVSQTSRSLCPLRMLKLASVPTSLLLHFPHRCCQMRRTRAKRKNRRWSHWILCLLHQFQFLLL